MKTFLQLVADSLLQRYGSDMSRLTLVFPGKRARLFFAQALANQSATPVWAPRYTTISELFQQASPYSLCDGVESVCRLYRVYASLVDEPQSLDQFYGWGEVLLSDFDDVDKHLADAHRLFSNIHDIKALDDNSYITTEQEQALRAFFSDFSIVDNTLLKERFLQLWNKMGAIYDELNASMRRDGLLYEGALQRDVVQSPENWPFDSDMTYAFVGFNVLNDVERSLFDELQRRGQALFYWDYDEFYVAAMPDERHEAGYFIRQNLERYGNELPVECFRNMREPKQLTLIAASSENAQARYLPQWLSDHLTTPENRTAVVLCNEQLLLPVLHTIPPAVQSLNVTMGYAFTDTPVSSFIDVLLNLHTDGYDAVHRRFRASLLRAVSRHPLIHYLDDSLWKREVRDTKGLLGYVLELLVEVGKHFTEHPLYAEAVFVAYTRLNRLVGLMSGDAPLLDVSMHTLRRVVHAVLQSASIPFHGEPAVGLQVMGVLETRALDFDHVLMLSVGEGYLPKSTTDASFIPYHLKEAFGLTTIRHKVAVYAYYFYRLIQRASQVTFVYNESNAGTRQNELSRFLRQLQAETTFPMHHLRLQAASDVLEPPVTQFDKTEDVVQTLRQRYDCTGLKKSEIEHHLLSPSALNRYTTCPVQFYYRYVKHLSPDEEHEDEFDAIHFGNIFHRAAELLYLHLTAQGDVIRREDIDTMLELGGQRLEEFVSQAFREKYFEGRNEEYTGILLIARRVLVTYLMQLLQHDRSLTPIRILGLETKRMRACHVLCGDVEIEVYVGGIIDRLDQVHDDTIPQGRLVRVVDYKTGGQPASVAEVERLFVTTGQNEHYVFQSMLYATIVEAELHEAVAPCLFYVHKSGLEGYSPKVQVAKQVVTDVQQPLEGTNESLASTFQNHLQELLEEIFNPNVPFLQTTDAKACELCDFRVLCGR